MRYKVLLFAVVCSFFQIQGRVNGQMESLVTADVLSHFRSMSEYQLSGTQRVYLSSGELFSIGKWVENVRLTDASYHSFEDVAANVEAPVPLSTRYSSEQIYERSELFFVSRTTSQKQRLNDDELMAAFATPISDAAEWAVALDGNRTKPNGSPLLCGEIEGLSLVSLLQDQKWEVAESTSGILSLTTKLSEGQGACTIDVDVNAAHRPIRFEWSLGPGDMFRGKTLPANDVKARKSVWSATWKDGELVGLSVETKVDYVSGQTSGRLTEMAVEDFRAGPNAARFELISDIPNGTPVALVGSPQIRSEWRDGEVVRVYASGEIESLRSVQMAKPGRSWLVWSAVIVVGLGVVVFLLTTRRGK